MVLPKWAKNAQEFLRINREALEGVFVSENIHFWIDLIFGYKAQMSIAKDFDNLFIMTSYESNVSMLDLIDESVLQ